MTEPNLNNGDLNKILSHPVTLGIFVYMHKKRQAVGVREVQRALQISNPSTAYWHLNKLLDENVVVQHSNNTYELIKEFEKVNKIPININLEYYLIKGRLFPGFLILIIFSVMILITLIITISIQMYVFSSIVALFSLIIIIVLLVKFFKTMSNPFSEFNIIYIFKLSM